MAKLVLIRQNGDEGSAFHIEKQTIMIGRAKKSDIPIRLPTISRQHARIENEKENGNVFLTVLSKKNSTYVNSEAVNGRVPLSHGDVITIGPRKYVFRCPTKHGKKEVIVAKKKKKVTFSPSTYKERAPATPVPTMKATLDATANTPVSIPSKPSTPLGCSLMSGTDANIFTPMNSRHVASEPTMNLGASAMTSVSPAFVHFEKKPSLPSHLAGAPAMSHLSPGYDHKIASANAHIKVQSTCQDGVEIVSPAKARQMTWELLFEKQLASSDLALRNSEAIEACANELLQDLDELIPPVTCSTPAKFLDVLAEHTATPNAISPPVPPPASSILVTAEPRATVVNAKEPHRISPGHAALPVEHDHASGHSPHQRIEFPRVSQIKRALSMGKLQKEETVGTSNVFDGGLCDAMAGDAASIAHERVEYDGTSNLSARHESDEKFHAVDACSARDLALSPGPTGKSLCGKVDAFSPHRLKFHVASTASSSIVNHRTLALRATALHNPSYVSPAPVRTSLTATTRSPHQISTHFPTIGALKRALCPRETKSSPSAPSKTVPAVTVAAETKTNKTRRVSFGDVSVHSFPLSLDVVDCENLTLHMRMDAKEHSRTQMSVDEHEQMRTVRIERSRDLSSNVGASKFYGRTPLLKRFARVHRSIAGVSDAEERAAKIRENVTRFLSAMKRKDLQKLAKEHNVKASGKSVKIVRDLVRVYTTVCEDKPAETSSSSIVEIARDEESKSEGDEVFSAPVEDDEASRVLAECDSWSRRQLQNHCKKLGIKANSKTVVLLQEIKKHYNQ